MKVIIVLLLYILGMFVTLIWHCTSSKRKAIEELVKENTQGMDIPDEAIRFGINISLLIDMVFWPFNLIVVPIQLIGSFKENNDEK